MKNNLYIWTIYMYMIKYTRYLILVLLFLIHFLLYNEFNWVGFDFWKTPRVIFPYELSPLLTYFLYTPQGLHQYPIKNSYAFQASIFIELWIGYLKVKREDVLKSELIDTGLIILSDFGEPQNNYGVFSHITYNCSVTQYFLLFRIRL